MAKVWHKLKCVKKALKSLHVHQFKNIHGNILKWQQALDEVQSNLQGSPFDGGLQSIERVAAKQLKKWQGMEESALR